MLNKFQKLAIGKSFDDLNGKQEESAEGMLKSNPEFEAEVQKYRELRAGLNLLKDVPECQLTAEHLRTRLLSESLNPRSKRDWSIYVATATAAVSCLVLGLVWVQQGRSQQSIGYQTQNADVQSTSRPLAVNPPKSILKPLDAPNLAEKPASPSVSIESSRLAVQHRKASPSYSSELNPNLVALNEERAMSVFFPSTRTSRMSSESFRHGFGGPSNPASELATPNNRQITPPMTMEALQQSSKLSTTGQSDQTESTSGNLITFQPVRDRKTGLIEAKEEPKSNDVPLGG